MMKFRGSILFIAFFALSLMTVLAWAVYLPKTGQIDCYDIYGYEVLCSDAGALPGQDAKLQKGVAWPDPRFTNPDGTPISGDVVLDRLTGLIWTKNAGSPDFAGCSYTGAPSFWRWQEALDYVACLNSANYLGYNDWRLPNINELESLANTGATNIVTWLTNVGFSNVQSAYWSSTSYAANPTNAWIVETASGSTTALFIGKTTYTYSAYVWPVRGPVTTGAVGLPKTGQTKCYDSSNPAGEISCVNTRQDGDMQAGVTWPDPRYTVTHCSAAGLCANQFVDCDGDSSNDVVTDNLTGLMWVKDPGVGTPDWATALSDVDSFTLCGFNGWRLPNRKEIQSHIDFSQSSPVLKTGHPFSIVSGSYWTSTTYMWSTSWAWSLDIVSGSVGILSKGWNRYVWPVRDTPNISLSPSSLSFPDTNVGSSSATQLVTLINKGTADLAISNISKLGDDTMFNVTTGSSPDACPNLTPTLSPGGKCSLEVAFAPGLSCDRSASLDIQSNDPDAPHAYLSVSGKGLVTLAVAINPPGGGTVTGSSITGANIDCPGDCSEVYNTDVVGGVTLAPSALTGYLFSGWTGCNSVTGSQCFITTETNKNVTAVFIKKSFIITIGAGANGVITPGTTQVEYGANKAFDIIPNTGYRTKEVIVDGVSKGAAISVSFTNIIGDHSISAVFEAGNYLIASTAGSGGTVSCTSANVAPGASSVCTATPDAGYKVLDFQADGVSKGKIVSFTFDNVTNNHTVNVTFEKSANLKAVKAGKGNGDIVPSVPGQSCGPDCIGYVTGQRVTVMAKVESGSIYKGWTGCDSVSGNYCTVKMDKDRTVTANFDVSSPDIVVEPMVNEFGAIKTGRLKTKTFKIRNNGTGYLGVTVSIDGTDTDSFRIRSGRQLAIKPGRTSSVKIIFKPLSGGEKSAILKIESNDPDTPLIEIPLNGSGGSKAL